MQCHNHKKELVGDDEGFKARPSKHLRRRGVAVAAGGAQAGHLMKCILDITGRTSSAVDKTFLASITCYSCSECTRYCQLLHPLPIGKVGTGETFSQTSQPKIDTSFLSLFAHNAMINITSKKQTDRQTDRETEKQTQSSPFLICDREILPVIVVNWHITLLL